MVGTVTNLIYHVVFGIHPGSRRITRDLREDLYQFIGNTVHSHGGSLIQIGGTTDHVHLLLQLRSEHSVSDTVLVVKSTAARWMEQRRNGHRRFAWQPGFGAFSVGESQLPAVSRWLRGQERHHHSLTFRDELIALLWQHRVALEGGLAVG
jgi:REP element-mobilizing transposase RayT